MMKRLRATTPLTAAAATVTAAMLLSPGPAGPKAVLAIPAFPGAEGFGMNALGGRGGDVYHVTSLADTLTPGTLRYGLRESGFPLAGRTIVFDVGGTIQLTAALDVKNISKVTIAGQTAPSPVTIIGNTIQITGSSDKNTNDIVMRHLSVRKGVGNGEDAISIKGSVGTGTTNNIILDHISASWSEDEVISVTQRANNVTIQNSMMSEALTSDHAYGSLVRPMIDSNVTYSHNLYSNQKSRNPRPGSYDGANLNFEFANNVIYNWSDRAGYIAGADTDVQRMNMNYVGNYLIAGPSTASGGSPPRRSTAFIKEVNTNPLDIHVWQEGNKIDSIAGITRDGLDSGWGMFATLTGSTATPFPEADKAASVFAFPIAGGESADLAYARVMATVGAFPHARDTIDRRLVANVTDYTGSAPITAPPTAEWNALLAAPAITRPAGFDVDNDGMAGTWEAARGLNPAVADNNGASATGYTNLENYLNELAATAAWNRNADGNWSGIFNWAGELPNSIYASANFGAIITAPRTVTVDLPVTTTQLNFDSTHAYTIAGGQTITLDVFGGYATSTVVSGGHTVSAPVVLADNLLVTTAGGSTLSLSGSLAAAGKTITKAGAGALQLSNARAASLVVNGGSVQILPDGSDAGTSKLATLVIAGGTTPTATLDLADNGLVVGPATSGAMILAQVVSARNSGAWDGPGITSSFALSHAQGATTLGILSGAEYTSAGGASTFSGQSYSAGDTLVKYTWYGDADFSGLVDFDDYVRIDSGYNASLTGWLNGDFDYSSSIDFDDYVLIDLAYNAQSGTLRRATDYIDGTDRSVEGMNSPALRKVVEHFSRFGIEYGTHFLSAVPEPTAAAGLMLFAGAMLGSRSRASRISKEVAIRAAANPPLNAGRFGRPGPDGQNA